MAAQNVSDYSEDEVIIARFAKAMGHPARISILNHLSSLNNCYFGDIDKELPIAKATVSQHLAELKKSGLIQGTIEPPKVKYCLDPENWALAKSVFEKIFSQGKCCGGKNGC